jgi:hypothetical protein
VQFLRLKPVMAFWRAARDFSANYIEIALR